MTDKYFNGIEGKVIYKSDKGWGHITTEKIPFEKIYFYWTAVKVGHSFNDIQAGTRVKMNVVYNEAQVGKVLKGWKALSVEVLD